MRYVCPKDVKKMLLKQARSFYWKKWAAKHGNLVGACSSFAAQEDKGRLDGKASKCCEENIFRREISAEQTLRSWLVGHQPMSSLPQGGRHRKAQALPLPRMVRSKTGVPRGFQEVGPKSKNLKEKEWKRQRSIVTHPSLRASGTGSKHKKMPGKCTGPKYLSENLENEKATSWRPRIGETSGQTV